MNTVTKFCDNCGATIRFDAKFCFACGQPQVNYANNATGLLSSAYQLKQRYRILEKLGQGGFGAVYKVEDGLFHNALRAVKEMGMRGMNPQETQDAIAAFRNEAQLLANLLHPNLPRIYDHFEEMGRWYLVMDYIAGETLQARLDKASSNLLTIAEVIEIGLQLCSVLEYLHSHQPPIIFRDLKPDNVMLTVDDHIYLIDFGIARFFKPGQAHDTMNLGTPGYASPEQYGRMQTSVRSDIYSLGATLYHLLSGISPGWRPFLFQPLELDSQEPGNAELESLIMQMLEMKEEKRPESAESVKERLQHIQSKRHVVVMKPVPTILPNLNPLVIDPRSSFVVAQHGGGDYVTISEAIQHASAGTFILVQEGVYRESLVLDRDVQIIGSGPRDRVIVESAQASCVVMSTEHATLRGLTLRGQAAQIGEQYYTLDLPQGQLFIENCDISSSTTSCIAIHNAGANPTIRYCSIHDSPLHGIAIYEHAQGLIEHCEIFQNDQSAITIMTAGNPAFRHCRVHDNLQHGIFSHDYGQGTFENCEIYNNTCSGVTIMTQGSPLFLWCQLHHNLYHGVEVLQEGKGSLQECEIAANAYDNVLIATGSTPYFYLCKIHDGEQCGVTVQDNGKGIIEYCEINANAYANVSITRGGNPLVRYSKIWQSKQSGIHVYDAGQGNIEYCTIGENASQSLDIASDCHVTLKNNQLVVFDR